MQTIHITIRGDDLSDLEIRKLPPHKANLGEKNAASTLHKAVFKNKENKHEQSAESNARQGNPL